MRNTKHTESDIFKSKKYFYFKICFDKCFFLLKRIVVSEMSKGYVWKANF